MTLESIYYIGQTVAVIGILASILMVWRQLKQGQKMERAAAQRDVLLRVAEWVRMVFRDGDSYDALVTGLQDYGSANALTQMSIDKYLSEYVFICESALNMHRNGFFSDGTWAGIDGATLALLRTPGGRKWWTYAQHWVGTEISEYLNNRLLDVDPETPTFLDFTPAMRKRLEELTDVVSDQTGP